MIHLAHSSAPHTLRIPHPYPQAHLRLLTGHSRSGKGIYNTFPIRITRSRTTLCKAPHLSEGIAGSYETAYWALGVSKQAVSGIVDLLSWDGSGKAVVQNVGGNSNLMVPRTVIPMIVSDVGAGVT